MRLSLSLYYIRHTSLPPDSDGTLCVSQGEVWIYATRPDCVAPPSPCFPIVQSYVDVVLTGALELERLHGLTGFATHLPLTGSMTASSLGGPSSSFPALSRSTPFSPTTLSRANSTPVSLPTERRGDGFNGNDLTWSLCEYSFIVELLWTLEREGKGRRERERSLYERSCCYSNYCSYFLPSPDLHPYPFYAPLYPLLSPKKENRIDMRRREVYVASIYP